MTDKLIRRIIETQNPSVAGIDTSFDYLPDEMKANCKTFEDAAKAIYEFNVKILDALKDIVPAVKVQVAYYEMYGVAGMKTFYDTCAYAKELGYIVIADVKRNDIGSTAGCYSSAYLGETKVNENNFRAFQSDYATINAYLGQDGIFPFLKDCKAYDKGIFVLVKTSNPTSEQLQDLVFENGKTLYETVGELVCEWGKDSIGEYGYNDVGAVVGATKPVQAARLRKLMPNTFFLVPGYGAQGATASDLKVCFDENGRGAIVNSSRGILCAYKNAKYSGLSFDAAARQAALDMKEDLLSAIGGIR